MRERLSDGLTILHDPLPAWELKPCLFSRIERIYHKRDEMIKARTIHQYLIYPDITYSVFQNYPSIHSYLALFVKNFIFSLVKWSFVFNMFIKRSRSLVVVFQRKD